MTESASPSPSTVPHPFDPSNGFLAAAEPSRRLPDAYAAWDELAAQLPPLLATHRVHRAVGSLPVLDAADLPEQDLPRAMLVLSFLGQALVWENWEHAPQPLIPAVLARPWVQVARRMGRPPVLSYASYALDNWRRLDPDGPIEADNLALLVHFLGGMDEQWFVTIHVQIEAEARPAIRTLPSLQAAATAGKVRQVERHLRTVLQSLEAMVATLRRMPERCDPYIYYHRVRPYIHGFTQYPVVFEGEFNEQPQALFGETGAQSGIIPALDAVLSISHAEDPLRVYLQGMRAYMPPAHRAFLEQLERGPNVRAFAQAADDSAVRAGYNAVVEQMELFRTIHLRYAADYIHRQARVGANDTDVGTGGTPFMRYLKKHRDETAAHELPAAA